MEGVSTAGGVVVRYPDALTLARLLHDSCPVESLHIGDDYDRLYGRERSHWEEMARVAIEYFQRLNRQ